MELLIVVAVLAVLMGLLLPALAQARQTARRVRCASQLRSIGVAWIAYGDQNRQRVVHGGMDAYVDGTWSDSQDWPATMDVWRGDLETPAWSGYGILIKHRMVGDGVFYCPSAMTGWVPKWHREQEIYGDDELLIGSIDPDKIGLTGLMARCTYYQRGVGLGAPPMLAETQRRAIAADCHFKYEDWVAQKNHKRGLNVLYTGGSVIFRPCANNWNVAFEGEEYLVQAGWGTWDDLDTGQFAATD